LQRQRGRPRARRPRLEGGLEEAERLLAEMRAKIDTAQDLVDACVARYVKLKVLLEDLKQRLEAGG